MTCKFCTISYDNPDNIYHPGDTLSGKIEMRLDKRKNLKGVRIKHKGLAQTKWEESTFDSDSVGNTRVMTYSSQEIYFDTSSYCIGGENSEFITLGPGRHVFEFSYHLPRKLPSSFKSKIGSIRYFTEVVFERAWRRDQKIELEFQVTSGFDLNSFPALKEPARETVERDLCCWCCSSGPLQVALSIPRTGYLGGETVDVVVDVDNASRVDVTGSTLKFQQLTRFYGVYLAGKFKNVAQVYEEHELGSVKRGSSENFKKSFKIPPLSNSCAHESSIIKPEYQIYLEVSLGIFREALKASVPLTIGTVRFSEHPSNDSVKV